MGIIIKKTTCFRNVFKHEGVKILRPVVFKQIQKIASGHMIPKQMRFLRKTISNFKNDIGPFLILSTGFLTNMLLRRIKRDLSFQIFKQGDGTL